MKTIHNFNEVFDGQKVFRSILDAMAMPGKIVDIHNEADKMWGTYKGFLAIAMTLIDNQVSFNVCRDKELEEEIQTLTLSNIESTEKADFIFVTHKEEIPRIFEEAKSGTLSDPHKGATLIVKVEDIFDHQISIQGPGVEGIKVMDVPLMVTEILKKRDAMEYEYPRGIDLIFMTPTSRVFCLPRLISWEE